MAESDDSQKTEDPTQRKLDEAHRQGQVPKSQEVRHWFMLMGIGLSVAIFAGSSMTHLTETLSSMLGRLARMPVSDGAYTLDLVTELLEQVIVAVGLPLGVLVIAAIAGNIVQHRFVWSFEKLAPKLSKISPLAGAKRLFSMQSLFEFVKSLLKIIVVGAVVFMLVWPEWERLPDIVSYDMADVLGLVFTLALRMIGGVIAVMTVIAIGDYMFQRFQFMKQQRMSKQEVKDEYKQLEGDPTVKAKLRQIRAERSRRRMMAAVPDATVVITNPTHYAVALKYEHNQMEAPMVVAKGVDAVALRIRELANENEVPIIENPPLARALFASVEVDESIPPEHYKAVAEVIGFVLKLSKRKRR